MVKTLLSSSNYSKKNLRNFALREPWTLKNLENQYSNFALRVNETLIRAKPFFSVPQPFDNGRTGFED